jgi:hypothetical protein
MPNEIDPGFEPGVVKRVTIISIVFLVFGIVIIPMSLTAFRSGESIPMLSHNRPIYGWEGFVISFFAELIGVGGLWAAARHRAKRAKAQSSLTIE